jgi:hypothetical protein
MKIIKEGFDLLDVKDVDIKVQHLFLDVIYEDDYGRLFTDYKDGNGSIVDREVLSISRLKFSFGGIVDFSSVKSHLVSTLYISDSVTNLVFFIKNKYNSLNLDYAAFIATGSGLDKNLFLATIHKYPAVKKHYTIYGNSLIGKIKDCKVQHWLNGEDCLYRIDGELVISRYQDRDFILSAQEFTLRNHLPQLSVRQTLSTYKPKNKKLDNFYEDMKKGD